MAMCALNATIAPFWPKLACQSLSLSGRPYLSPAAICFQKKQLTFVVLRWTINSPGRNVPSSQKRRCPNNFAKKRQKTWKNGSFFVLVGASPWLRWGCISPLGIDRSTQNYKRKLAFLKNGWQAEILLGPNLWVSAERKSKSMGRDYKKRWKIIVPPRKKQ